jgi:hypothetical protein
MFQPKTCIAAKLKLRWATAVCVLLWLSLLGVAHAQDSQYGPKDSLFNLPWCADENWEQHHQCSPEEIGEWRRDLLNWRDQTRDRVGYDDSLYKRPVGLWAQSSFMQAQMMVEERYFYDPVAGRYTVDRYLDDLEKRFGGIDSVLIWPGAGYARWRVCAASDGGRVSSTWRACVVSV